MSKDMLASIKGCLGILIVIGLLIFNLIRSAPDNERFILGIVIFLISARLFFGNLEPKE